MYKTIVLPAHVDPEINIARNARIAKIVLPEAGVERGTGLLLLLNENVPTLEDSFRQNKMKQALAEKWNCVVAEFEYYGHRRPRAILASPVFKNHLKQIYGVDFERDIEAKTKEIKEVGGFLNMGGRLAALDARCKLTVKGINEYQSWGLLDAIDGLNAVGHLLAVYALSPQRVYLQGKRYGGYVAQLMSKFAPDTFTAVIDMGGYTGAVMPHIVGHETLEPDFNMVYRDEENGNEFMIPAYFQNPWTIRDEQHPRYFGDSHRIIRSLLAAEHWLSAKTHHVFLHDKADQLVKLTEKKKLQEIVGRNRATDFLEADRGVLDLSFQEALQLVSERLPQTSQDGNDFNQAAKRIFRAADVVYCFTYRADQVEVKRERLQMSN